MGGGSSGSDDLIPIPGQSVIISYECHLENGTLVDSSIEHQDINNKIPGIKLVAGMGQVIEGWDMCILTMRLGEKCDLHLTSKYAFG